LADPRDKRSIKPTYRWFLAVLGALGAALVAHSIRLYGPGLSPDSVGYISIARSLAASGEYVRFDGGLAPEWPPLYPLLAALLHKLTGADALITAGVVNALCHGVTVYVSGLLLARVARESPLAKVLGVVAVAMSPALLAVSVMAWTEPLFICCVALFLLALHGIVAGDRSPRWVALAALFAALAALTRYIGVALIPVGALVILLYYAAKPLQRWAAAALYSAGALLPLAAWMWRNQQATGTLMGARAPSSFTLSQNLGFTWETIQAWFLPKEVVPLRYGLAIGAGLVGFLVWALLRQRLDAPKGRAAYALPSFLLIVAYLVMLIVTSTTTAYDQITNRLVAPIWVPLVVVLMVGWDLLTSRWAGRAGAIVAACALVVAFAPWFLYMKDSTTKAVESYTKRGAGGYNTRSWRESPLIAQLQTAGPPQYGRVYTNGPDVLYILTPLDHGVFSPRKGHYNSALQVTERPNMKLPARLIWFNGIGRAYLHTVNDLRQYYELTPVQQVSDGAVYVVGEKG